MAKKNRNSLKALKTLEYSKVLPCSFKKSKIKNSLNWDNERKGLDKPNQECANAK